MTWDSIDNEVYPSYRAPLTPTDAPQPGQEGVDASRRDFDVTFTCTGIGMTVYPSKGA